MSSESSANWTEFARSYLRIALLLFGTRQSWAICSTICTALSKIKNIAALFGNAPADPESWHAYLLKRMTLTIESVRPSVIGSESYEALGELRRCGHLFRHAYTMDLDWERMSLVLRKVDLLLRNRYRQELAEFIAFLDDLSASLP
ncbi:MAG TPA: hypothetical protein VNM72_04460 [Blastocatellia bacterium]|nr:hypothetical protein [Blastocatellia bacterium]